MDYSKIADLVNQGEQEAVIRLPLDRIEPDRGQPRKTKDQRNLADLAASIRAQGIIQPIIVLPADERGMHVIVAGERRWAASGIADMPDIPAIIRDVPAEMRRVVQLVENMPGLRENVDPREEAAALLELKHQLGTAQMVSDALGVSPAYVSQRLALLELPESITDLIDDGITKDVDTLNALGRLSRLDAETADTLIEEARDVGNISRAKARETLAKAKRREVAPEPEPEGHESHESEGNEPGQGESLLPPWDNGAAEKIESLDDAPKANSPSLGGLGGVARVLVALDSKSHYADDFMEATQSGALDAELALDDIHTDPGLVWVRIGDTMTPYPIQDIRIRTIMK